MGREPTLAKDGSGKLLQEVCLSYVMEGRCHEKNYRKRILGRGNGEDQGPEAGKGAVCWRRTRPVWPGGHGGVTGGR